MRNPGEKVHSFRRGEAKFLFEQIHRLFPGIQRLRLLPAAALERQKRFGLFEEPFQALKNVPGGGAGKQQAGIDFPQDFHGAADRGSQNRNAARQRLDGHQPEPLDLCGGQHEDVGRAIQIRQGVARDEPQQADPVLQTGLLDEFLELGLQAAGSGDQDQKLQLGIAFVQQARGQDEVFQPHPRFQPAHGQDERRLCGNGQLLTDRLLVCGGGGGTKFLDIDAAGDHPQAGLFCRVTVQIELARVFAQKQNARRSGQDRPLHAPDGPKGKRQFQVEPEVVPLGLRAFGFAVDLFLVVPEAVEMVDPGDGLEAGMPQGEVPHQRVLDVHDVDRPLLEDGMDLPADAAPEAEQALAVGRADPVVMDAVDALAAGEFLVRLAGEAMDGESPLDQAAVDFPGQVPGPAHRIGIGVVLQGQHSEGSGWGVLGKDHKVWYVGLFNYFNGFGKS